MAAIKDISTLSGAAQLNAAIRKEQHFSALFASRDAARRAATGASPFRLNPAALKTVARTIGAADPHAAHRGPGHAAQKAADLEALRATLSASRRAPQEKDPLPRTTAGEYGWHWKAAEAPQIARRPLVPAWNKRCGEVVFAEAFASVFMAGPFDKTQPICRAVERAEVAKKK